MKIITWNVNSIRARLEIIANYIDANSPDVVAIQETKVVDEDFPIETFKVRGYDVAFSGQKAYNGVALMSKFGLENSKGNLIDSNNEKRTIQAQINDITIINAYFPHGRLKGGERFFFKLEFFKKMKNYVEKESLIQKRMILLGDFNVAPEEIDVWDHILLGNSIGFMDEERDAFRDLVSIGLIDAFRLKHPNERAFSWWDYRDGSFRKNEGMRIDHILISPALQSNLAECFIDKGPRKLKGTSDHAPVVVEIK